MDSMDNGAETGICTGIAVETAVEHEVESGNTSAQEPEVIIEFANIPEILKAQDRWASFEVKWNPESGKFDKRPVYGAKSNDPATWVSFDEARKRINRHTGISLALPAEKTTKPSLVVIDIDHCIEDGQLSAAAEQIVRMFAGTYIERSLSGDGLHIFVYGTTRMNGNEKLVINGTALDMEVYSSRRFIVMTGNLAGGGTSEILNMQPQLDALEAIRAIQPAPSCCQPGLQPAIMETNPGRTMTDLAAALSFLNPSFYDTWFRYGIAIRRWGVENDREEEAWSLFDQWSRKTGKRNYDEAKNRASWDSWDLDGSETPVTLGTIFHDAAQAGYHKPRPVVWRKDAEPLLSGNPKSIEALRAALWSVSQTQDSATERNRSAGETVCRWLKERGQFFFHEDLRDFSSAMFFDAENKLLGRVQSDAFLAWLSDAMGVNRAETLFKFTAAAVETEALSGKDSRAIIPAEYWHSTGSAVYLSCGPGRAYRITAQGIDAVDNGTDGVVFSAGSTLKPWTLTEPVNPFEVCSLFNNAAYISPHGKTLLQLWACTMLTHQRTKPPLCISGTVGSGKTRLAVGLFELLGMPPRVSSITKNGEPDFWAQVSCGGLVTFDNADTRNDWLADSLAAAATDGGQEKRRLYTDAERVYLRARSWVIITSANPTFAADAGLADRLLVIRLDRLMRETAESTLTDEISAARDGGLSWMAVMIQRALADTAPVPKGLNRRHPDHAAMAFRIGRAMGMEGEAVAALQAAELDKSHFNLENDPLGVVLLELVESSSCELSGTAAELAQMIVNFDPYWDGKCGGREPSGAADSERCNRGQQCGGGEDRSGGHSADPDDAVAQGEPGDDGGRHDVRGARGSAGLRRDCLCGGNGVGSV